MLHLCEFCFLCDRATSKRDSLFWKHFHMFLLFLNLQMMRLFCPPLYLVLGNPHPSVTPKHGRFGWGFFALSLWCKAKSTLIPAVCNPPSSWRGCHGLLLSLCSSASTIPQLQACSNCFYVHVVSQQTEPRLQPKELFVSQSIFIASPWWSVFP